MDGFLDGDFRCGNVRKLDIGQTTPKPYNKNTGSVDGCWTMDFSPRADILAVGLNGWVEFLETRNYSTIHQVLREDKVSAIQWCRGSALTPPKMKGNASHQIIQDTNSDLVAVAGLGAGQVSLYQLNAVSLEFEGVKVLHEFHTNAQVRCMAFRPIVQRPGVMLLAVGDRSGRISLCTLFRATNNRVRCEYVVDSEVVALKETICANADDPVLGLDFQVHEDTGIFLAYSTKSGKVAAHSLQFVGDRIVSGPQVWTVQRNGPIRSIIFSLNGKKLLFGGYDKSIVIVDTKLFAVVHDQRLQGTVNTIALDPLDRFFVVGCRDKSFTFFDTSTCKPVKRLQTPGWVTSISWGKPGIESDIVAVRSENTAITLLDMTPIHMTDVMLSAEEGNDVASLSWSPDGSFLSRLAGDSIYVVDVGLGFKCSAEIKLSGSSLRCIAFSPVPHSHYGVDPEVSGSLLACVGLNGFLYLLKFTVPEALEMVHSVYVEKNLWVVAWSEGEWLSIQI
jgi:WD40 repeat protein